MARTAGSGIYVEVFIRSTLERVWHLTQQPGLHQRWDLRFSEIQYLPKRGPDEPQRFLYRTRIGLGLSITGTGESVTRRPAGMNDSATSSLKFGSEDRKSLITTGAGYWRYVPTRDGLRFITWYDYSVRFGPAGKLLDRIVFRPLNWLGDGLEL